MDNVVAVSCGVEHTAAIDENSVLWMWGSNDGGELGNGGIGNVNGRTGNTVQTLPVKVMDNVTAVSCGRNHTTARKTDGSLWTWGWSRYGQLGNGGGGNTKDENGNPCQTVPVKVMDRTAAAPILLVSLSVVAIAAVVLLVLKKKRKNKKADDDQSKQAGRIVRQTKKGIRQTGEVICSCGAVNPATVKFCQSCGKKLEAVAGITHRE